MENPYESIRSEITDIVEESPNIKTFTVELRQELPFEAGQFVEVSVPGVGEAPFTPSSSPRVAERMELTIMEAGEVTGKLHRMKPGQWVGVRGPYGQGYPLEKFEGKQVLIVGGGVGLAPLRSLIYQLTANQDNYGHLLLKYGARTPSDLIYKDELEEWGKGAIEVELTVDEGDDQWEGNVGVVTTLLEDLSMDFANGVAVVCGPPIMMKFTVQKLLDYFDPEDIYLSMEKNMSCGIGLCGHCQLGPFYVCKDGPVFSYHQLKGIPTIWE